MLFNRYRSAARSSVEKVSNDLCYVSHESTRLGASPPPRTLAAIAATSWSLSASPSDQNCARARRSEDGVRASCPSRVTNPAVTWGHFQSEAVTSLHVRGCHTSIIEMLLVIYLGARRRFLCWSDVVLACEYFERCSRLKVVARCSIDNSSATMRVSH